MIYSLTFSVRTKIGISDELLCTNIR
eukprot:UN09970